MSRERHTVCLRRPGKVKIPGLSQDHTSFSTCYSENLLSIFVSGRNSLMLDLILLDTKVISITMFVLFQNCVGHGRSFQEINLSLSHAFQFALWNKMEASMVLWLLCRFL
ncbi:hypothetical protein Pfo_008236 [Paulownia fortunei]|nr:hypothetical protein Pfo_008236 [Paulownia fortunei]